MRMGRRIICKYYMPLESRNDAAKRGEERNHEEIESSY